VVVHSMKGLLAAPEIVRSGMGSGASAENREPSPRKRQGLADWGAALVFSTTRRNAPNLVEGERQAVGGGHQTGLGRRGVDPALTA